MTDPRTLPKESIRNLRGYEDEAHGGINLSNNANLFGPNPAIAKALASLPPGEAWDYPSLTSAPLREALAARLGVDPSQVLTGNGSNDLIDVLIRAYVEPGGAVAYHPPTFAMIPIFARTNAAQARPVPLGEGFRLDAAGLAAARGRVTFVVSPNNPTGNAFAREDVLRVVREAAGLVVVDEAYAEFAGESLLDELPRHPNLVILRTFSKAYGLAGLRVGYAVAHPDVARAAAKVRGPFRLNLLSERAATLALAEQQWLDQVVAEVARQRDRLARELAVRGFAPHPSRANFVLARVPPGFTGATLAAALRGRDVQVRDFTGDLVDHLRITVAPAAQTDEFLERLDRILKGGPA